MKKHKHECRMIKDAEHNSRDEPCICDCGAICARGGDWLTQGELEAKRKNARPEA
jgi:hypothetical protein